MDAGCRASLWLVLRLQPRNFQRIKLLLDALVPEVFPRRDIEKHHYRASLFKARRFWPFGSWLGIVARSGHKFTRKTTIFSIDENVVDHNIGFAGECWWQGHTFINPRALPDLDVPNVSERDQLEYKAMGFLADVEFSQISMKSRVFLATCIRVDGKLDSAIWGVLVLDSTDSNALPNQKEKIEAILNVARAAISHLVSS